MKKSMKRAVAAVAAAAGIAGGSFVATAPAQAATPNLVLTGGVYCKFGFTPGQPWTDGIWNMTRFLTVTARGADFPNVTLQEFNGEKKFVRGLKRDQSLTIKTVWRGCFPSSIAGYTISSNADNLVDNAGFWWNMRQIENIFSPSGVSAPNSGGGNTTQAHAQQAAADFAR
ncbi:hypothetical protein [Gordonia sp. NPDC003376]